MNQANNQSNPAPSETNSPASLDASRRQFLKASSAAVAGAAIVSQANLAHAYEAYGDREIKIGLIGCGGRGTGAVIQLFNGRGPIKLVAMADAFDFRLKDSLAQITRAAKRKAAGGSGSLTDYVDVPESQQFVGLDAYEKVLASDCDLVVLATPPGFRPDQFDAAVEAGKHIFTEKPMAVDAPGVRKVLAAGRKAEEKGLAVQVGLQRRHEPKYIETVKRLHEEAIGDLVLTRVYWNGGGVWTRPRSAEQTEMEYQVNNWYYFFWVCGGQIVEQHIHNLDVANWVNQATPIEAQAQGGREVRTGKEHGQIFDHTMVEYTYPGGARMLSCCRHVQNAWGQVGEYAHGTKGTANIGGGKIYGADGKLIWKYEGRNVQGHQQEQLDMIDNLRAGRLPNETEYGALSTMTAVLGRMAAHSGQVIPWDKALSSDLSLGGGTLAWDATPPVVPDDQGRYPVPVPGKAQVL